MLLSVCVEKSLTALSRDPLCVCVCVFGGKLALIKMRARSFAIRSKKFLPPAVSLCCFPPPFPLTSFCFFFGRFLVVFVFLHREQRGETTFRYLVKHGKKLLLIIRPVGQSNKFQFHNVMAADAW